MTGIKNIYSISEYASDTQEDSYASVLYEHLRDAISELGYGENASEVGWEITAEMRQLEYYMDAITWIDEDGKDARDGKTVACYLAGNYSCE